MYFQLERVTQPDIEVIELDEMRRHLRLFEDVRDDDADVQDLITAAREWAEHCTGRVLIEQQWKLTLSSGVVDAGVSGGDAVSGVYAGSASIAGSEVFLRRSPVLGIVSVNLVGTDGTETLLGPESYALRGGGSKYPSLVMLNGGYLTFGTVVIVMRCGFADRLGSPMQGAEMVPKRFKQAMKLWASGHYDADVTAMPALVQAAEALIMPERALVPIA